MNSSKQTSGEFEHKCIAAKSWDEFYELLDKAYVDGWCNAAHSLDDVPLVRHLRRRKGLHNG